MLCTFVHGTTRRTSRRPMGNHTTLTTTSQMSTRRQGPASTTGPRGAQRHPLAVAHRGSMVRPARALSTVSNLSSALSELGSIRCTPKGPEGACPRPRNAGQVQTCRVLHRRDLCGGEKGGSGVGETKRGKGTKLMAVADGAGLPLAIYATSASPHEVTLVEDTLA